MGKLLTDPEQIPSFSDPAPFGVRLKEHFTFQMNHALNNKNLYLSLNVLQTLIDDSTPIFYKANVC